MMTYVTNARPESYRFSEGLFVLTYHSPIQGRLTLTLCMYEWISSSYRRMQDIILKKRAKTRLSLGPTYRMGEDHQNSQGSSSTLLLTYAAHPRDATQHMLDPATRYRRETGQDPSM